MLEFFELRHFVRKSAFKRVEVLPPRFGSVNGRRERIPLTDDGEILRLGSDGRAQGDAVMVFEISQTTFDAAYPPVVMSNATVAAISLLFNFDLRDLSRRSAY